VHKNNVINLLNFALWLNGLQAKQQWSDRDRQGKHVSLKDGVAKPVFYFYVYKKQGAEYNK